MNGFCNANVCERPEHDWILEEIADPAKYEGHFKGLVSICCKHCHLNKIVQVNEILKEECMKQDEATYTKLLISKIYA
jgi:hypothetical protein